MENFPNIFINFSLDSALFSKIPVSTLTLWVHVSPEDFRGFFARLIQ
jgi:hypothetical protein